MPLLDIKCPSEHEHEVLLSQSEFAEFQRTGSYPCPTCEKPAIKQLSKTGSMAIQWRRAAHGQST